MPRQSSSIIESGLRFFIRFLICTFLGVMGSIVCSILILLLLGKQPGVAWLQSLLASYDHMKFTLIFSKLIGILWEQVQQCMAHTAIVHYSLTKHLYAESIDYINAALIGLTLAITRLVFLLHKMVLFLELGFVGLIDGLTQRCIRRAVLGRESALVHHHAKNGLSGSLLLGIFLILLLPLRLQTIQWTILFFAVWFGFSMFMVSKSFKKYL